jgi:hypothetical protein
MHCITRINNLVYATFVPHKVNIDVGVVFDGESITFYTKKSEILYGASLFISTKKLFFFNSVTPFFHPFFISISTFFSQFHPRTFFKIIQVVFKPAKSNRSHWTTLTRFNFKLKSDKKWSRKGFFINFIIFF